MTPVGLETTAFSRRATGTVVLEFVTHLATGRLRTTVIWAPKLLATMNAGWVTGAKTRAMGGVLQQAIMTNMAMASLALAIMNMDHIALKPTPRIATTVQRSAVMLVMIQGVVGTATIASNR